MDSYFFWFALILSCHLSISIGAKIEFKLSARNLPRKTDPFAEVRTLSKKTGTIDNEANPDWSETFEFFTQFNNRIEIEVRDNRAAAKDESLGWARIHSSQFLEKRTFHEGLWTDDGYYMGTLRVTVRNVS